MKRLIKAELPTEYGEFEILAYANGESDPRPHLALVHKQLDLSRPVLTRIHSECITGDVFGSRRCDCGEQLETALRQVAAAHGIVIYLRQEGRGIGLINKLKSYNLQSRGMDTSDANVHLGFEPDPRRYDDAVTILKDIGVKDIELLTNNPLKINALESSGVFESITRVPLIIRSTDYNRHYLETKKNKMGHWL